MTALALHLWLAVGLSARVVRSKLWRVAAGSWQLRGRNARGWAQLYRWAERAADLFLLPRPLATSEAGRDALVGRVLTTLRPLSPVALSAAPIAQQILRGSNSPAVMFIAVGLADPRGCGPLQCRHWRQGIRLGSQLNGARARSLELTETCD